MDKNKVNECEKGLPFDRTIPPVVPTQRCEAHVCVQALEDRTHTSTGRHEQPGLVVGVTW